MVVEPELRNKRPTTLGTLNSSLSLLSPFPKQVQYGKEMLKHKQQLYQRRSQLPYLLKHHFFGSRIQLDSSAQENISLEKRGSSFLLILVISTFSSPIVQLEKPSKTAFILTFSSLKDNFKVHIGSLWSDYRPLCGQAGTFLTFISALFSYGGIYKEHTFSLSLENFAILVMCLTARSPFTAFLTSWQLPLKIHPVVKTLSPAAN